MYCRSISLLICMFTAVSLATLYGDKYSTTEWSVTESVQEARQGTGEELGALLDAGDGAVVTVEAGGTRLVAHRAVLAARSPVLASMLPHYSGRLSVPGVEGPVLRHLLAYLYTLRAPRLAPGAATQLLAAAHRFGLPALQADCERQVAEHLSVETVASAAVLAVKHSANHLRDAALNFIKDHHIKVLGTKGWADALENQPKEAAEVSHLLADRLTEICGPATMEAATTVTLEAETTATMEAKTTATMDAGNTTSMEAGNSTNVEAGTTANMEAETSATMEAGNTTNMEAGNSSNVEAGTTTNMEAEIPSTMEAVTTATAQPDSGPSQPPATATPPLATCPTSPLDEATVSRLRSLSGKDRDSKLMKAAEEGAVEELRALLAAGVDVEARDKYRRTALHWAADEGHAEAASCLLGGGAQVGARDVDQWTPLHWAAVWGRTAVVRRLLAASADPNARENEGKTPLHLAAIFGRADVAAALLGAGADKGARDKFGRTPLDNARRQDNHHLFEMLTQR